MLCEQVNRCKHNREGNDIKKEAAKENKETRKHLLECAGREFLEKGYMKASLRNICKEAGVTTGALYFFFKDKEDLFAALVEKPLKQLYLTMEEHYAAEMRSETQVVRLEQNDDDLETSREIIRQMYANRDAFLLLLTKSQGSRFENCLDEIVDISEQQYRRLCDMVTGATGRPRIDDYMTHLMAHIMVDTFGGKYGTEACGCPDQVFGPGLDGHDDGKLRYMHPEKVWTLQGCCFRIST